MYLSFKIPDCASDTKMSNALLILLARQPDIIIYIHLKVLRDAVLKILSECITLRNACNISNRCKTESSFFLLENTIDCP